MKFKTLSSALLLLATLASTACQSNVAAPQLNSFPGLAPTLQTFSQTRVDANWFEKLPPQLQAYYAPARGLTGEDLFDALHRIVSSGNRIDGYSQSKSYVYAVADNAERENSNTPAGIQTAYSQIFVPGRGGNGGSYKERGDMNRDGKSGDFINCEHTWPQSFFGKAHPMRADMHHLVPTFSVPNNRRGHFPFGMASNGVRYSTSSGSKLATGNRGGFVFEPNTPFKGNTARAMQYFYLRYYRSNIRQGDFERNEFWVSKVPMFREWSEKVDPVDAQEQYRNQKIFEKQQNRNPFIDIPNLASLIGDQVMQQK